MYDIVIVGAGTAGLTAAIYGARAGLSVLVLESTVYGGQIINALEIRNYPAILNTSGYQFASDLFTQATALGAIVETETVFRFEDAGDYKKIYTRDREIECKTIIIATGAKNRPLGFENEKSLVGHGVSYCATCDGAFYSDQNVAVVGGGHTAIDDALFLSQYCNHVYVIHRRQDFRAQTSAVEALRAKSNVIFLLDTVIDKLNGTEKLESLTLRNHSTGEQTELIVQGLFVAVGQTPENGPFSPPIALDDYGYIIAGEDCKTNVAGVFAAGDCRTKTVRQLVTAASDGAVAALAALALIS